MIISKIRAGFLSGREGWLGLEDEVLWARREQIGSALGSRAKRGPQSVV